MNTPIRDISMHNQDTIEKKRNESYNKMRYNDSNERLLRSCEQWVDAVAFSDKEKRNCRRLSRNLERYVTFGRIPDNRKTTRYINKLYKKSL